MECRQQGVCDRETEAVEAGRGATADVDRHTQRCELAISEFANCWMPGTVATVAAALLLGASAVAVGAHYRRRRAPPRRPPVPRRGRRGPASPAWRQQQQQHCWPPPGKAACWHLARRREFAWRERAVSGWRALADRAARPDAQGTERCCAPAFSGGGAALASRSRARHDARIETLEALDAPLTEVEAEARGAQIAELRREAGSPSRGSSC